MEKKITKNAKFVKIKGKGEVEEKKRIWKNGR